MPIPLVVLLWGLLAIAVITAVGRWCRAHPAPPRATTRARQAADPDVPAGAVVRS